jgi:molybdopterin synthase sulfur carrier subunit
MALKVRIPAPLRKFTDGSDLLDAKGATIGEVLSGLCEQYPEFKPRLFKQEGTLNRFVNVFVNEEDIRFMDDLATPVKEGDDISIIQAVAGG